MTPPELPKLPADATVTTATSTTTVRVPRSHFESVRDAVVSTALLVGAFGYLHLRGTKESFPNLHDTIIVVALLVVALSIGYRDRLKALTTDTVAVIKARKE